MGVANLLRLAVLALALPVHSGAAHAEEVKRPLAVVELFTSQGCRSCPPADQLFAELARRGDVVALAYHVDYWDYLGWRDTLGNAENTARQREYGHSFGKRGVYTPQAVINGRDHVNGAKRGQVEAAIERFNATGNGLSVDVSLRYGPDSVIIETGAAEGMAGDAQIVLVYFERAVDVTIERGENRGKTVTYWNAVSGFHTAGMWHGDPVRIELPKSEVYKRAGGGCAVLVQRMGEGGLPGPILGAAIVHRPAY